MPSTYAHFKMGQEVRQHVGGRMKQAIEEYPELYLIGLHGPDILFYYKALSKNPVNQTGYKMHERAGEVFFSHASEVVKAHREDPAYLSYVCGFICHFALDVTCHGYVGIEINQNKVTHTEIEAEFDRELMVRDGLDPIRRKLTEHIIPSIENARVISAFFEDVTAEQVQKALSGMICNHNMLRAPSKLKRQIIYTALKLTGHYEEMHGLIINYEKNQRCQESTEHLLDLYAEAELLAERLIHEYMEYLEGNAPLHAVYRYNFESRIQEELEK